MTGREQPLSEYSTVVARQFASRPTLRQVLDEALLPLLRGRLPWLDAVQPPLQSTQPLTLISPVPGKHYWTTSTLLDELLQALLQPHPLDWEPLGSRTYNLGLDEKYRFAGSDSPFDTRSVRGLNDDLNALLERLPSLFCQAQVAYWRASAGGAERDAWLQVLLKTALLQRLPRQKLDEREQACVRGLLAGGAEQPAAYTVSIHVDMADQSFSELRVGLLLTGEWDDRERWLWYEPSGRVAVFAGRLEFAAALRDRVARDYQFERLQWTRRPVTGDPFAVLSALMLEQILSRIELLQLSAVADVQALEALYANSSDPSPWFDDAPQAGNPVQVPPGLVSADAGFNLVYQDALLTLSLEQLQSQGQTAHEGINSLQDYTWARLTDAAQRLYDEQNPIDDLLLEVYVAAGMPGGAGAGTGGGEPLEFAGERSLADLAIGNLSSLTGLSIKGFRRSGGGSVPAWLNAESARRLVQEVDIGGNYPAYVVGRLDDPPTRAERVRRYAAQWRSDLLFSALEARLASKVSHAGLQCVIDFCNGHIDAEAPRTVVMPLAFKRQPASRQHDQVRGMFVLHCAEPTRVLLYRPLYKHDRLREYADIPALMAHVRESPMLSESILVWLDPQVREIYDHDGFQEPHVTSLGIDPFALPERPVPAVFAPQFWIADFDERLYSAHRDLLLELAHRQSTSNAESRWAILQEGGWMLFNLVTLSLSGPLASVAWLLQFLASLQADAAAIEQAEGFERQAAWVDLVLNLGLSMLHLHLPRHTDTSARKVSTPARLEGRVLQRGAFAELAVAPVEHDPASGARMSVVTQLDWSWRGNQGFNGLPPERREALRAMRADIAPGTHQATSSGPQAGLYAIDGQYYAAVAGDVYRVEHSERGVRIVGRKGEVGPWLTRWEGVWRVDTGLRLRGGGPGLPLSQRLAERFSNMREQVDQKMRSVNTCTARFATKTSQYLDEKAKVDQLRRLIEQERAKHAQLGEGPAGDAARAQSSEMIKRYEVRQQALKAAQFLLRDEALQQLERAIELDQQVLRTVETMQEPKYSRMGGAAAGQALEEVKRIAQRDSIRHCSYIIQELRDMVDYPHLDDLHARLIAMPHAEARAVYDEYRLALSRASDLQERMLKVHAELDATLGDAPPELDLQFRDSGRPSTVAALVAERAYSLVQLRFHQAMTLAELGLPLSTVEGQRLLPRYRAELSSQALRNAASAHGQVVFGRLSAGDLIAILQEAWDEYAAALINCKRMQDQSPQLVDVALLGRYAVEMERLKEDAGQRLVEAIGLQDAGGTPPRHPGYPAASQAQRAVRNLQGQIMIANERVVDGVTFLEVLDPISDELWARFEEIDGEWREVDLPGSTQPFTPAPPVEEGYARVSRLIQDTDRVCDQAKAYAVNDIKGELIQRLFDDQLTRIGEAMAPPLGAPPTPGMLALLKASQRRLTSQRLEVLTSVYTETLYPTAAALRFLYDQQLIRVEYVSPRQIMANGSAFDEYKIIKLAKPGDVKGRSLWVAHMHMPSPDALPREFTLAHLKTWGQRKLSDRSAAAVGQRVHRGALSLAQAEGIIPFD